MSEIIWVLIFLTDFTQHNILKVLPCCHKCQYFIFSYGWVVFRYICMYIYTHIYTFNISDRREGREKERERNINVWLSLARPLLGTWPSTQACALTGNWTSALLVHRPMLNPLSHISQGYIQLSIKGHFGCLHVLATVNNTAMNIRVAILLQVNIFSILG